MGNVAQRIGQRETEVGSAMPLAQFPEHAGGGRRLRIFERSIGGGMSIAIGGAAMRAIERCCDPLAFGHEFPAPCKQADLFSLSFEEQSGFASARRDTVLIAADGGNLVRRIGRTFLEQAM